MLHLGKMNLLCVIAHPDDLECMAGGSIARWSNEGHNIHVLTLTDGVWTDPNGTKHRNTEEALSEEREAGKILGYTVENLKYPAMNLEFEDRIVVEILKRIDELEINAILCPWEGDLHHDHEIASRIAISASRRVPRVIMGQINHYIVSERKASKLLIFCI